MKDEGGRVNNDTDNNESNDVNEDKDIFIYA